MSVLFAILLFSFLIFIHELGHFLTAKLFGVQVNEFSMFMGPALWKKQIGETLYTLRTIPIGGYCAMEGEDGESDNPRAFVRTAWWKRLIILAAGAAMNFLVGVVLIGCFFLPDKNFILPVVSELETQCSFAGPEGIQIGDRVLAIDNERIYVYSDFTLLLGLDSSTTHNITVERNGQKLVLKNQTMELREFVEPDGSTRMRYGIGFTLVEADTASWLDYSWNTVRDTIRLVRLSLRMLLSGQAGLKDVSGPVGIVQQMSEVADSSGSAYYAFLNLVYFGGFIAINLAIMNLLPIPALDGGRIVGVLLTGVLETVTRKKLDPKYESYIHAAGMALLLLLMAVIMLKDVFTLFTR